MAGIGDTRLGDGITAFSTAVRDAALAEHERAAEATGRNDGGPPGRAVTAAWHSSGSSADRNGIWRGGVALGSYGEAQQRVHGHRGWGRYRGVQAYFPDSEYVKTAKRCGNYSFELGEKAECRRRRALHGAAGNRGWCRRSRRTRS